MPDLNKKFRRATKKTSPLKEGDLVFARGSHQQFYPSRVKSVEKMPASGAYLYTVDVLDPHASTDQALPVHNDRALRDYLTECDLVAASALKPDQRVLFYHGDRLKQALFVGYDSRRSLENFMIDFYADTFDPSLVLAPQRF